MVNLGNPLNYTETHFLRFLKKVRAKVKSMLKRIANPRRAAADTQTQFGFALKLKLFNTATPKLVTLSEACVVCVSLGTSIMTLTNYINIVKLIVVYHIQVKA